MRQRVATGSRFLKMVMVLTTINILTINILTIVNLLTFSSLSSTLLSNASARRRVTIVPFVLVLFGRPELAASAFRPPFCRR